MRRAFFQRRSDRAVALCALGHGLAAAGLLALAPALPMPGRAAAIVLLALGLYWGSNTVSHIHLHTPLFTSAALNRLFSLALTLSLAVPQRWWQRRHLGHHRLPDPRGPRLGVWGFTELALLTAAAGALAVTSPSLFAGVWLPALALGLLLCALAGHGEHAADPAGVDHHGRRYNRLCFNDGFHAAHHRRPELHWTLLPALTLAADARSVWPPLLRWLEGPARGVNVLAATLLDTLERLALGWRPLRTLLLSTHEPALRALLAELAAAPGHQIGEVVIVGGGLFPRTALLLGQLLPAARLVLLDASASNLAAAAAWLPPALRVRTSLRCGRFDPAQPVTCDLLVVPLAFRGDRRRLYLHPPAPAVLVHDWAWSTAPRSADPRSPAITTRLVSALLCKRLSLVKASFPAAPITGNLGAWVAGRRVTLAAMENNTPSCFPQTCSNASAAATPTPS